MKYDKARTIADSEHEQTSIRIAFQRWRDEQEDRPCTCWMCGTDGMNRGWNPFRAGAERAIVGGKGPE